MPNLELVDEAAVRRLLNWVAPNRAAELSELLEELSPVWLFDRTSDRTLFQARLGKPNEIRMGLKGSVRLEIHAHATTLLLAILERPEDEHSRLFSIVNQMLTWAVGVEVTRVRDGGTAPLPIEHPFHQTHEQVPHHLLSELTTADRNKGGGIFVFATAWILFHELGHLKLGHTYTEGYPSLDQEREADHFAADWMAEAASKTEGDETDFRPFCARFGTGVALLWITVIDIYFGPANSSTHPQGYDRLFQVIDRMVDRSNEKEYESLWRIISLMLRIHMASANYFFDESDESYKQGDPRDEANYLIDRISRFDRRQ